MFSELDIKSHIISEDNCVGFRVVEDQQYISTRPLVDSDEEHDILEAMLEDSKPPKPTNDEMSNASRVDYLLSTPFRYPPLKEATRFGKVTERSLFYGCHDMNGAFAEVAYYRFRFIDHTTANIPTIIVNYTSFKFYAGSEYCIDLTHSYFEKYQPALMDKNNYQHSQEMGRILRHENVEMFYFNSVRSEGSKNIAIFVPSVFTKRTDNHKSWQCVSNDNYIEFYQGRKLKHKFGRG